MPQTWQEMLKEQLRYIYPLSAQETCLLTDLIQTQIISLKELKLEIWPLCKNPIFWPKRSDLQNKTKNKPRANEQTTTISHTSLGPLTSNAMVASSSRCWGSTCVQKGQGQRWDRVSAPKQPSNRWKREGKYQPMLIQGRTWRGRTLLPRFLARNANIFKD